ncbi:Flavin-binding monooxygenase-like protein, partial [Ostertagia ostertagi]
YEDKRVVAVGIGNSGADIAVELSRVSEEVYLSTSSTKRTINARFDHAAYGLQPKHDVFRAHTTQNDELPIRIASGTVVVKPNIERFTEHDVYFIDGTKATNVDYPLGSIMPIAEMQARVFFSVLSGESTLPNSDAMRMDMLSKREAMRRQYVASHRHTIQVDYIPFMDELATIIGCRPRFLPLLCSKIPLAISIHFMGRVARARNAILELPERVKSGALRAILRSNTTVARGVSWPLILVGFLYHDASSNISLRIW